LHTPIKLAFLVRSLDYGGAQRQLITLAKALDQDLFDVTVISFYSGQPLETELANSAVRFISLDKRGRWDLLGFLRRLIHQVRVIRPDILHGYLDIPNLLALFIKPLVHARVVWGIRVAEIDLRQYDWLRWLAAQLERMSARFADLIIVNSAAGFERYRAKGLSHRKMIVIPNGIDTDLFKPDREAGAKLRTEWLISEHTKLIGTVGRLDPMKDLPTFLEAAALVCRRRNDVRFACIGAGPASYTLKLQKLTAELGISDKVSFSGARADVTGVYNALDVFCSSSYGESLPNSIAEAMACGVPCVVTDVGDSALLVGDCGIVVRSQDTEALAAGIIRCLTANQSEAGKRGRVRITENFSVRQLAERTAEALICLTRP